LGEIAQTGTIRTPKVISVEDHQIVLEKIECAPPTREFWTKFGTQLAQMHKIEQRGFGFVIDNHIGATPQANPRTEDKLWADYFIDFRLKPMAKRLKLEMDYAPVYQLLAPVDETPSLVHGDLWNGNFLCAENGDPVLIDPAPYWGHREVDLAMSELFGGFAPEFYESYSREYPVQAGYEQRRDVYNLYHLLNHWVLFGGAYQRQARALIELIATY
jgi:protein-ribulosamine 3-kinase